MRHGLSLRMRNDAGALARVVQVLTWQRCRVEHLVHRAPRESAWAWLDVEFAHDAISPDQIRRHLEKLVDVADVTELRLARVA